MITSMGDNFHVRLNDLHVDAVLLLPNDDSPPKPAILALLLCTVGWNCVVGVICLTPINGTGI